MLAIFLGWNSKKLNESSGKEKESRCLAFKSSTKHEIRHFHVVVVQWLQRNVQKSVIHVQSCCFTNRNPLLFAVLVYVAVVLALALKRGFISMVTPKGLVHRLKLS